MTTLQQKSLALVELSLVAVFTILMETVIIVGAANFFVPHPEIAMHVSLICLATAFLGLWAFPMALWRSHPFYRKALAASLVLIVGLGLSRWLTGTMWFLY